MFDSSRTTLCLVILFVGLFFSSTGWAQKKESSVKFEKPFFAYLGIEGQATARMPQRWVHRIEKRIRRVLERGRYMFVKIPYGSRRRREFVRKMVSVVAAKAQGLAKMKATWNSQFQGFVVTSSLLNSIQNRSFYYWIDVTEAYTKRRLGLAQMVLTVKIHVHRLFIFDCSRANRAKSRVHNESCRYKRKDQYVGFAKEYKVISASSVDSVGADSREEAFRYALDDLRQKLSIKVLRIRAFQLHAPVAQGSFMSVKVPLGKAEGVQLNQGFDVYVRHVRGHLIHKGFVRIRSVGDNRMKMVGHRKVRVNHSSPYFSTAQPILGGPIRKGMLLYERPQTGILMQVTGGLSPVSHASFAKASGGLLGAKIPLGEGTLLIPTLQAEGAFDLSAQTGINEFFVGLSLEVGFGGSNPNDRFVIPFVLMVTAMKRFYVNRLGFVVGARAGGGYLFNDPNSGILLGGDLFLGFDVVLTQELSLLLRGGFRGMIAIGSSSMSVGPWGTIGASWYF